MCNTKRQQRVVLRHWLAVRIKPLNTLVGHPQQNIQERIEHLIRLAERPGTPAEGANARQKAIDLSLKYGIPCKFTIVQKKKPIPVRRTEQEIHDNLMNPWVIGLNGLGWRVTDQIMTKVGRQLRFRKTGFHSEVRVTQRKNSDGKDFEGEHIMQPDPDEKGQDRSYTSFICISLPQLLTHLAYTKTMGEESITGERASIYWR